jgi:hypothetical protein
MKKPCVSVRFCDYVKCVALQIVLDQQGLDAWYGYKAHAAECNSYPVDC